MKRFVIKIFILLFCGAIYAENVTEVTFDCNDKHQTMHSFGASDCWRVQYIGKNWPLEKREAMAKLLFSSKFDENGDPQGIGLTLWRFNIGSGSHDAANKGGIDSEWRRTECFLDSMGNWDWSKQEGQRWFLNAAKKYKVPYTLGFSITAPYFMTKNGLARASEKTKYANIQEDKYDDYAEFMTIVSKKLQFDYLSPINEPQWEWVGGRQEGMQATNEECARLIKELDKSFSNKKLKAKIVFGEAGDIRYLYRGGTDKPDRDNQIKEMFASDGVHGISHLKAVAPIVTGHSYWSTWPLDTLVETRRELDRSIKNDLPTGFEYWQTEYCPMEKNEDNPQGGGGRDLGMNTALYIARIIHHDLVDANATSWQSWTTFTEWNYKDGLLYIDDGELSSGAQTGKESMIETCKYDGTYRTSKYLWALGNYSLFIRPGMKRIGSVGNVDVIKDAKGLMYSAYIDEKTKKKVVVFINYGEKDELVKFQFLNDTSVKNTSYKLYETSEGSDLSYRGVVNDSVTVPARSLITVVSH